MIKLSTVFGVETWVAGIAGLGAFPVIIGGYHWKNPHEFGGRRASRAYSSEEDMSGIMRRLVRTAAFFELVFGLYLLRMAFHAVVA